MHGSSQGTWGPGIRDRVEGADLAGVGPACDVLHKDARGKAAVVGGIALADVDGRVQDGHPSLLILVQQSSEVLQARARTWPPRQSWVIDDCAITYVLLLTRRWLTWTCESAMHHRSWNTSRISPCHAQNRNYLGADMQ